VFKTKSRRSVEDTSDWHDLWTLYGNFDACFAATATAALKNVPPVIIDLLQGMARFRLKEANRPKTVFPTWWT
jgi:hypothetical protein